MNTLTKYQSACEDLAIAFYHKYYAKEEGRGEYFSWLNGIGSHFIINDQCFSPYEMLDAMRFGATREQLRDWYYDNMYACCEMSRVSLPGYLDGQRARVKP